MQSYRDILLNAIALVRRTKLNFVGDGVQVVDNPSTLSTDVTIPGLLLTIVDYTVSSTVQVGQMGRFTNATMSEITATLASGTVAGQMIGVIWNRTSTSSVAIATGNIDDTYPASIRIGVDDVYSYRFVWNRIGVGAYQWWVESVVIIYPP